jgi:8-oxo-dGTP pyrophosphatase MutT (NUDIX family)
MLKYRMDHIYSTNEQRKWQQQLPKKNLSAHILVRYQQKILMVKPSYKNHFVFPGGIVEESESPQQAAIRELGEETGISVSGYDLRFAGISYTPPHSDFPEKVTFSFLYDCQEAPKLILQQDEIQMAEWVAMSDILEKAGKKRALYANIQDMLHKNLLPFYCDLTLIP